MSIAAQDFDAKARVGLQFLAGAGALTSEAMREADAFFARNPEAKRTPVAQAFIIGLILDQFSNPADSQSAENQKAETKKVA